MDALTGSGNAIDTSLRMHTMNAHDGASWEEWDLRIYPVYVACSSSFSSFALALL